MVWLEPTAGKSPVKSCSSPPWPMGCQLQSSTCRIHMPVTPCKCCPEIPEAEAEHNSRNVLQTGKVLPKSTWRLPRKSGPTFAADLSMNFYPPSKPFSRAHDLSL